MYKADCSDMKQLTDRQSHASLTSSCKRDTRQIMSRVRDTMYSHRPPKAAPTMLLRAKFLLASGIKMQWSTRIENVSLANLSPLRVHHAKLTLGSQIGLHTLAMHTGRVVNVLAGPVGAHERDGLDSWLFADEFDGGHGSVHDRQHTLGQTCERTSLSLLLSLRTGSECPLTRLFCQFGDNHGSSGVALRRLDDERIAGCDGIDGPQRDHGREVETVKNIVEYLLACMHYSGSQ